MKRFASLWRALDEAPRPSRKEELLVAYFREAPAEDAVWALRFLFGPRPKRAVAPARLREWAAAEAGIPGWLLDASHEVTGDLAETVSHLLDGRDGEPREWPLHRLVAERLEPLAGAGQAEMRELLRRTWRELPGEQRLVWNKLVTGTLRTSAREEVVLRALAVAGCEPPVWLRRSTRPLPLGQTAGGTAVEAGGDTVSGPRTIEAVLVYAQRSEGGRGSHYTELTLAVWDEGDLVPVARVEGSLPAAEVTELDRWVRRHVVERFGPVRRVSPELVFELAFEGAAPSGRHKAGVTLRAPRLVRWLRGRGAAGAATLAELRAHLPDRTR